MLSSGIGGPADPVAAYAWFEAAALDGNGRPGRSVTSWPNLSPAQQAKRFNRATALQSALAKPIPTASAPAHPAKA